jgi:hypothetical protein
MYQYPVRRTLIYKLLQILLYPRQELLPVANHTDWQELLPVANHTVTLTGRLAIGCPPAPPPRPRSEPPPLPVTGPTQADWELEVTLRPNHLTSRGWGPGTVTARRSSKSLSSFRKLAQLKPKSRRAHQLCPAGGPRADESEMTASAKRANLSDCLPGPSRTLPNFDITESNLKFGTLISVYPDTEVTKLRYRT